MLCVFLVAHSFAQKGKKEIIYLKNGSIFKGRMVPVDDERVVINSGKNSWVLQKSDVDTVMSSWFTTPERKTHDDWFINFSGGFLAGSSSNTKSSPLSLQASFNYKVYKGLYAGIGAGVEFLEESYLPAFVNVDYYFRETTITPFIGIMGGYMIPLDDKSYSGFYQDYSVYNSYWPGPSYRELETDGSFMVNPRFGFKGMFSPNFGWTFSIGYRYHQLNFSGEDEYEIERNYNRLSIQLGILFN